MNENQNNVYEDADALREILKVLKGKKYILDCGHHVSFWHNFGNNIIIYKTAYCFGCFFGLG